MGGLGGAWGRLGPHLERLQPHSDSKIPQHSPSQPITTKNPKTPPPQNWGRRHETLCVGLGGNARFLKKQGQNLEKNAFFKSRPNQGR